jgi:hypothetical protein
MTPDEMRTRFQWVNTIFICIYLKQISVMVAGFVRSVPLGKLEMISWGSLGASLVGVDRHVEKRTDVHEPTLLT